jgi:F0F1-type ATP synthase delta subunit
MELLDRLFGKGDRAAGYAAALVAIARAEDALPRVEDELFAFANAVDQNPQLREA